MSPFRRWLVKWARLTHLYLTLTSLALVLFFTITGFMLNHEKWFVPENPWTSEPVTGTIPEELLTEPETTKLEVAELLREKYGAVGLVSSFDIEDDSIRVVFKRPGTEVEAKIKRDDGAVEVVTQAQGVAAIMLDLHRGKATGLVWSLVIDGVCVVLVILATTGLILWSSLKGRGRYGLAIMALGLLASVWVAMKYAM